MNQTKEIFYYPELDGLRFFAFLLVFVHHTPVLFDNIFFKTLNRYGWLGVDLFLCLSAFLFAKLLYVEHRQTGTISIKNFYIRRALRIWPLYFFFLAAMFWLTLAQADPDPTLLLRTAGMVVFVDNVVAAIVGNYSPMLNTGHLWTISYEEQFYAVIPWSLRKMFKNGRIANIWTIAAIFLLFTLVRAVFIYTHIPHPAIWTLPITHFESILAGLAAGLGLFDDWFKKLPSWALTLAGLFSLTGVCLLPDVYNVTWLLMLSYPLVGLGMYFILLSVLREERWGGRTLLQQLWLSYLGKISYGLYVYHLITIDYGTKLAYAVGIFPERLLMYPLFVFAAGLMLTILIAVASYHLLEKPFLRFKERFSAVHSRPL